MIISIGREFGSGGHDIAEKVAAIYNIPIIDHSMLDEIAAEHGLDIEHLKKFDEKPKNRMIIRRVKGFTNSLEDAVAEIEFDYIKKKADKGESFVIVGRCSESLLKGYPDMYSVFINGDMEDKIARTMRKDHIARDEVERYIRWRNRRRKIYHNTYSTGKWGDSRNYDLTINSSRYGIDGSADLIRYSIEKWQEEKKHTGK